ncbi:hydrogenase, Fe-only [Solidesulfovibrio fructosivorans JJ]]|uniref:Hydrogenase, Fe-only n=1 Tax=Solidesulfovibrio fructosivorans JJ] TaxID=596151 RepID=E1JTN6_SOLFR|nr:[FeFe] hydrogenase, group A [Solidesulfovibrio fructosivorans]EFL52165.1 hydrogenase, Fe-only [Solidesulfovibrio fructosivorans JJ]]
MTKSVAPTVTIDGKVVPIEGERNLLELIRKVRIDLPTFCYHSELSVYGACRLCLVEVKNRGIMGACSTPPEPGMEIRIHTKELREIRKIAVELLLANHNQSCPTCFRNGACKLQEIARKLGVSQVRFKPVQEPVPVDVSSPSLVRDPNKCVLCGDCVRMCSEIQGIGAIGFAFRGHKTAVLPAFGKGLANVECVNCGQCSSVCPTGALTPKSEIEDVWNLLANPEVTVVAQIAPAVRVGLGECFGAAPGDPIMGRLVAAMKTIGFDQVYDTTFAADLTVIEEAEEFLARKAAGEKLPQFTSCCPGWVQFAEQYYPELLPNLSSCRSPQQMFGSLVKEMLPEQLGIPRKKLAIVSVMPCTAKKFEARRPEFAKDGSPDVDNVLTTQEMARMIEQAGLRFNDLEPQSRDMPYGFGTGAGVIFGTTGGVTEAVLRYAAEKVTGQTLYDTDFNDVRGESGLREVNVEVGGNTLHLAVVYGLANARVVCEKIKAGTCDYDLIEVMACPGGCVGGAGQPVNLDLAARKRRAQGLYRSDKGRQLHKAQDNVFVNQCYAKFLGDVGGHKAHELLHTGYQSRRRIADETLVILDGAGEPRLRVQVCLGTSCHLRGAQDILTGLLGHIAEQGLTNAVDVRASFCHEKCADGPTVQINGDVMTHCTLESVIAALDAHLQNPLPPTAGASAGTGCACGKG